MSYQGHLPDGSSVQKHSAGSAYPFIVFGQETPKGLRFGVMGPAPRGRAPGTVEVVHAVASCEQACSMADRLASAYRRIQAQRKPAVASIFVAASGEHVDIPLNTPEFRAAMAPGGWGVV